MADTPLTKLDTAWLHLDEPTNRMVINGFFRFAQEPDWDQLEVALTEGFEPYRRFRQRVVDRRSFLGRSCWVDDEEFDLANHLERVSLPEPGDEAALQDVIDGLLVRELDSERPLWKIYVIDAGEQGCLRPASKAGELGNFFALVTPTLPVREARPRERLRRVKRAMDAMKRSPEGLVVVTTFRLLGLLGVGVQRMIMNLLASKTSLVVTNVPGPLSKLSFAGRAIEQIMFWVPMGGALGVGFSIFSYAGQVGIGIMTDEGLVPDPKALSEAVNAEFRELQTAFESGALDGKKLKLAG